MNLDKVTVGYSALTDTVYLYRHGKDKGEVLDKREAERDVMACITEKMMWGTERGSSVEYGFGGVRYKLTVEVVKGKESEAE